MTSLRIDWTRVKNLSQAKGFLSKHLNIKEATGVDRYAGRVGQEQQAVARQMEAVVARCKRLHPVKPSGTGRADVAGTTPAGTSRRRAPFADATGKVSAHAAQETVGGELITARPPATVPRPGTEPSARNRAGKPATGAGMQLVPEGFGVTAQIARVLRAWIDMR